MYKNIRMWSDRRLFWRAQLAYLQRAMKSYIKNTFVNIVYKKCVLCA